LRRGRSGRLLSRSGQPLRSAYIRSARWAPARVTGVSCRAVFIATVRTDIWVYGDAGWAKAKVIGFSVEALDGKIGKIDEASNEVGAAWIVVDTGPWIFGKNVMLPAGVIVNLDLDDETVLVNRTPPESKPAIRSARMRPRATSKSSFHHPQARRH
jgi:hypothetical protein